MGIEADLNLLSKNDMHYIEIIVDKYPSLIGYQGKVFYHLSSSMKAITGKVG